MQSSAPVAPDAWSYLISGSIFRDLADASLKVKKAVFRKAYRLLYSRSERRVAKVQKKDRPELTKVGWGVCELSSKFKLPPIDDKMERVDGRTMTLEEFQEKYERPRIPCVITGLTENWAANENWTIENFSKKYASSRFQCGETKKGTPLFLKFKYFAEYMTENEDDSPLYIFDSFFAEDSKARDLLCDYEVPVYFRDDLFELLGNHEKRPPYRWIVIGPARSGTNIHVDPLGTSAWNALIHGHKRWVFIHPDAPGHLVHVPKDVKGLHPKEAVTWFTTVYTSIREGKWPIEKYPVMECRQHPGETIFVPCGWWHVVINEDITVAVTQNFCSPINLFHVYPTILKERPGLTKVFLNKLNEERPEMLHVVYDSLLHSKPIVDDYGGSESEHNLHEDVKECESQTSQSSTDTSCSQNAYGDGEKESDAEKKKNDRESEMESGRGKDTDKRRASEDLSSAAMQKEKMDVSESFTDSSVETESVSSSDEYSECDTSDDDDTSSCDEIFRKSGLMNPITVAPGVKHRIVATRLKIPAHIRETTI